MRNQELLTETLNTANLECWERERAATPVRAFAVPVSQSGVSTGKVFLYTTLSGVVPQVLGSMFGFALVGVAEGVFPVAAGFAAGAMLAVVLREMVPSSHGHGYADAATAAFLVGFVLLVVVDAAIAV